MTTSRRTPVPESAASTWLTSAVSSASSELVGSVSVFCLADGAGPEGSAGLLGFAAVFVARCGSLASFAACVGPRDCARSDRSGCIVAPASVGAALSACVKRSGLDSSGVSRTWAGSTRIASAAVGVAAAGAATTDFVAGEEVLPPELNQNAANDSTAAAPTSPVATRREDRRRCCAGSSESSTAILRCADPGECGVESENREGRAD